MAGREMTLEGVIGELRELNRQRTGDLIKELGAHGGALSPEQQKKLSDVERAQSAVTSDSK